MGIVTHCPFVGVAGVHGQLNWMQNRATDNYNHRIVWRQMVSTISQIHLGRPKDCWAQGYVIGHTGRNSYIIDDGTGAVECFTCDASRDEVFSADGTPWVVIPEGSSSVALEMLREHWHGRRVPPPVGKYVVVWGGALCLAHPNTLDVVTRLYVRKCVVHERGASDAEEGWGKVLAETMP